MADYWSRKVRIGHRHVQVTYQAPCGDETVLVDAPITAEELLFELLDLLTHTCDRPSCRSFFQTASEVRQLQEKLGLVTAERDALERILTRKTNPYG